MAAKSALPKAGAARKKEAEQRKAATAKYMALRKSLGEPRGDLAGRLARRAGELLDLAGDHGEAVAT